VARLKIDPHHKILRSVFGHAVQPVVSVINGSQSIQNEIGNSTTPRGWEKDIRQRHMIAEIE
jgi:hypothetical protein